MKRSCMRRAAAVVESLEGRRMMTTVYALTTNDLIARFDSATPGAVTAVPVTGLNGGQRLLGIDFRPADNQMYGVSSDSILYKVNPTTGVATQVGFALSPAVSGTAFGLDFNPVVDRLRLVSDADQNLRINPSTGAVAAADSNLNPGNPNVVGSAYTNNYGGATTTTLFGIDSNSDVLVIQNPPNNGALVTVGPLGIDTSENVGFDIDDSGVAYAALTLPAGTTSVLTTINLSTGAATLVGTIGTAGIGMVRSIAVALNPGVFTLDAAAYSVTEAGPVATVTINRGGGTPGPASVTITTSDGTATAGVDYTGVNTVVNFGPGETSKTVQIPILQDPADEAGETVGITLSGPSTGTSLGALSTAVLTIGDDDPDVGVVTEKDPINPKRKQAVVTATHLDDVIRVVRVGATNNVEVFLNGVSQGVKKNPSRIVIYGLAGRDVVRVAPNVNQSVEIHGGEGDDMLFGGAGRDLLIGGAGVDALFGRGGEDILIAGTTTLDGNAAALAKLMGVWTGGGTVASRAVAVRKASAATGGFAFGRAALADDGSFDAISGGSGADLKFFNTDDEVTDEEAGNLAVKV